MPQSLILVLADPRFDGDTSVRVAVGYGEVPQEFLIELKEVIHKRFRDILDKIEETSTELVVRFKAYVNLTEIADAICQLGERCLYNCRRHAVAAA